MTTREQLEQALAGLEAQRAVLGEAIVGPAVAAIQAQLAALAPAPEPESQRKQVTVLFADVSGFTAMSDTMDAEDVQETMNALWQQVDKAILDHNGHIDKHIGDAVMALWGVDEAREDDPEQAIRAALAMQTAVHTFAITYNYPLKMRIGLNTGPVLLGEVGTRAEFTAMGDTVNTASRLEHAAPVGAILISHNTYRHVRGVFDVALQEPLIVKGKTEPLQVYVVKQAKARTFRTYTRGVEGVETRMVGRDKELQTLQSLWPTAVSTPQTTLITVVGEAGVGKSRLLYEFEQWLDLQPDTVTLFKGRSAEQTRGTPYFLVRDLLATRFGIRESDPIDEMRQKFEAAIADILTGQAEMKAHFLGQWLGYDFSHSPYVAIIGDNAEQLKNRGLLYLTQFLRAMAQKRPILLFLEDIHWADTPSLDAILDILRREPALPLFVVALTRLSLFEHRPAWRELGQERRNEIEGLVFKEPGYHFITLNPLPTTVNRELLAEILQKVAYIPEKLFNLVANRAEGNPFYMEELVKMLIDNGVIVPEEELWRIDLTQLDETQIPGTLTGVLQARLDRLAANEKVTLQRASVVGRVFWDTAVKELGDDPNQVQLTPLQSRELIYKQSETAFIGTEQFLFKHDLLRDVTYQTVLKKTRQLYHGQIANWLVEVAVMNGRVDEYAAVISKHYQLAGKPDQAAIWYGRAGQYAAAHNAHEETIHYLNLALEFTHPDDYVARYTLLQVRENTYRIQGNREAQQADLDTLTSLANNLSAAEQANVALQRASYAIMTSEYATAIATVQAAIKLAQAVMATNLIAKGHSFWGTALFRQGKYPAAKIQYATGYRLAKEVGEQQVIASCLQGLGSVVQNQGDYMAASVYYHQTLAICREIGDRYGEGMSLNHLGGVADEQEDYVKAQQYFEQALVINRESGNRMGEAASLGNLGFGALCQGAYARACGYFEQTLLISREINHRRMEGTSLINLGEVAANQGEYARAYLYFEQALAIFRKIGVRGGEGICLNELGAVALAQANISLAKTYYRQAMTIHQELNLSHYLVEDWAGLAQVRLIQGDQVGARRYGEQVLNYLEENSRLNGAENPMRVFRFTWEVLVALDQPEESYRLLALAGQIMQDYLDKNSDPALQEMYLRQPHHQVLWAAWLARTDD